MWVCSCLFLVTPNHWVDDGRLVYFPSDWSPMSLMHIHVLAPSVGSAAAQHPWCSNAFPGRTASAGGDSHGFIEPWGSASRARMAAPSKARGPHGAVAELFGDSRMIHVDGGSKK